MNWQVVDYASAIITPVVAEEPASGWVMVDSASAIITPAVAEEPASGWVVKAEKTVTIFPFTDTPDGPEEGASTWPWLLIGGGAVVAAVALSQGKKT